MRKFNLTISILKEWFNQFNAEYFNNELPMWSFQIKNSTSYFGKCFYQKKLIVMSTYIDREERGFQQTLIHEMIHEWQRVKGLDLGHGKSFKEKAAEINKKGGWDIRRCSIDNNKPFEYKARRERSSDKNAIIIMWKNYCGERCFSKVPYTQAARLYNYAEANADRYRELEMFTVPNTYEIQQFRKSGNLAYYYYDSWAYLLADTFNEKLSLR